MKRKLAIFILTIAILALWVTPALGAKGVITEVNPSGRISVVDGITDVGGDITIKEPGKGANKGSDDGTSLESR